MNERIQELAFSEEYVRSLRDDFAITALQAFLSRKENNATPSHLLAKWSYFLADEMLEARKK